jgi:hypothetical protein
MNNWIGKNAVDVVNYLLENYKIKELVYRAYIRKTEDVFDEEIPAKNVNDLEKIYKKYKEKDSRFLISFQSKVLVGGEYKHFPMIDFSNSVITDLTLDPVKRVLAELGEKKGFILNSGRCFHYYGDRLLSDDEWKIFMQNCAKHPEIGERYISHQLRRGKASLRLVTDESKPYEPKVLAIL